MNSFLLSLLFLRRYNQINIKSKNSYFRITHLNMFLIDLINNLKIGNTPFSPAKISFK